MARKLIQTAKQSSKTLVQPAAPKQEQEPTFMQKLTNPKTYVDSFVEGQKAFAEMTGVPGAIRELSRPAVSLYQKVKSDITGKPQENVNIPLVGEVKPYDNMKGLDTPMAMLDATAFLPFLKASKVSKLSENLKQSAEKMYESLLKPLKADLRRITGGGDLEERAAQVVQTGLANKIKITRGGQKKLNTLIETLDSKVDTLIEEGKAAGKKIDLYKLIDYVNDLRSHYSEAFGGEELVKKIDDFTLDFIKPKWDKYGRFVPIDKAQNIKQSTYGLVKKFFGALSDNTEKEVKKQLARGVKDQIAAAVPEIDDLNQIEKKLLDMKPALDRAIHRLSKKDIIGLQDAMVVWGELAATKGKFFGIPSILWKVVSSPASKSAIAIKLNQLSKLQKNATTLSFAANRALKKILDLFNNEE